MNFKQETDSIENSSKHLSVRLKLEIVESYNNRFIAQNAKEGTFFPLRKTALAFPDCETIANSALCAIARLSGPKINFAIALEIRIPDQLDEGSSAEAARRGSSHAASRIHSVGRDVS